MKNIALIHYYVLLIQKKVMKLKNKHDKEKLERQKEKLTADFINAEGVFKEINASIKAEIEEINYNDDIVIKVKIIDKLIDDFKQKINRYIK